MGYWVTLSVGVAAAFHHSLRSAHLFSASLGPLPASFSRLNSQCAIVGKIRWLCLSSHVLNQLRGLQIVFAGICCFYYVFTRHGNKIVEGS